MGFASEAGKIVAVYPGERQARRAAERVRDAAGKAVRLREGGPRDEIASLEGEMREELRHTIIGPGNVGPFTKEMTKGMARLVPALALLGAALLFPFSFIEITDVSLAARVIAFVTTGAIAGAVIGFLIGGGTRVPEKPEGAMAAEHGTLLVAEADDADVLARTAEAMAEGAIRVDVVSPEGRPIGDVTTEEERGRPDARRRAAKQAEDQAGVLDEQRRNR